MFVCFVVRGDSRGCRLFGAASMLRNVLPHHSQGMEPKYHDGGHCQSVLRPQGFLTSPFILNNSVDTAAPFNQL